MGMNHRDVFESACRDVGVLSAVDLGQPYMQTFTATVTRRVWRKPTAKSLHRISLAGYAPKENFSGRTPLVTELFRSDFGPD